MLSTVRKFRGRVGIEPTQGSVSLPHNGFEDRTPHQQRSVPITDHKPACFYWPCDPSHRRDPAFGGLAAPFFDSCLFFVEKLVNLNQNLFIGRKIADLMLL